MGTLRLLLENLRAHTLTHRPTDPLDAPPRYRGAIHHDTTRCTGCAACAYVCSPAAITLAGPEGQPTSWQYDAERCTFCALCAAYCPTEAISVVPEPPPATGDASAHQVSHAISYQPCAECGRPFAPLPLPALIQLYGMPIPAEIEARRRLCESCRRRMVGQSMKLSYRE
jgi:hydrogenase-4 component H